MDKDHFVDVSVIAEFKLIKQLTTDVDQIIASVRGSEQVTEMYVYHFGQLIISFDFRLLSTKLKRKSSRQLLIRERL